jgi:DNA-binding MarR family transcriptional regulator
MRAASQSDYESRASREDHQALKLWLRFFACANLVERRVRRGLRTAFATTLPRFDLMAQLERHPGGLTMGEISRRMMVTGGNITRITDQLVEEGLVARETSPSDRRALTVRLTTAGRRAFAAMAERHEDWIVEMFSALGHRERLQLYALLAKLKAHLSNTHGDGTR